MELLVELSLSLRQLDGDAELVLLGLHDRIGPFPLGGGHVLSKRRNVVVVLRALDQQPRIDRYHRNEAQSEHEHESGISASEIAPGPAAAVAFSGTIGPAARLDTALLLRSEDLHSCSALSRRGGITLQI